MPNPTAHADDMKSLAKPETPSPYWWLNPWRAAIQQAKASDIYRAWWLTTDKNLCKTAGDLAGEKLKADVTERAILDTANEAGFQASKVGYVINGEPTSPFPLKWLGEAVAYWKGEAYAARKQREEANGLADYHRNNLNTFQRKVEVALQAVLGKGGHEDTIELVGFAADEIKALREEQKGLLHEARVAIANNEVNEGNIDQLEARLDGKQAFINQALKDLEICQGRIAELEGKKKPKAKRKLSKLEKAKPLWEDKTKTLTHGVSFTLGNHEDRHDPVREAYASLGRKFIKAQAKAKKKGGRRA